MKKIILALLLCLSTLGAAYGQSAQRIATALQPVPGSGTTGSLPFAQIISNAQIYVCQYNTSLACTTPINIFSNVNLTGSPITQPLSANPLGQYQYYVSAGTQLIEKVCAPYNQCYTQAVYLSGGGGGGAVSSVSGDGTLFTNLNSTGGVALTLGTAGGHKWWGNNTGSTATPGYESIGPSDVPGFDGVTVTGTPSAGQVVTATSGSAATWQTPSSGSGITSLNGLTGPSLSLISSDSSVTITPSGSTINLQSVGGSGNSVQYNPSTTSYIVASFSGLYDDNDSNSTSLPVSNYTCTGGIPSTCTVNFTSAHGLSVGGAVDMHLVTSWPHSSGQETWLGSFQVLTVPSTTQITFQSPTSISPTCSSSCGNAYDASYWGIWQFARQPFIYGHGTVHGLITTAANMAANFSSLTSGLSGTPTYYIDQTGQNDFGSGSSVAAVEGYHQTIWAAAHTAGMIVVQTTMVPGSYGFNGPQQKPGQYNYWLWLQSKTPALSSSGQYIDNYVDTASALLIAGWTSPVMPPMPNPQANQYFAQSLNSAFASKGNKLASAPLNFTYSNSGIAGRDYTGTYTGDLRAFFDSNWYQWRTWRATNGGDVDTIYHNWTGGSDNIPEFGLQMNSLSNSTTWCASYLGTDNTNNNNAFYQCFGFASTGSTSNFMSFRPAGGGDIFKLYASGALQLPSVVASSGTQPLMVDTSGNVSVGTGGGTTTNALTAAASGGAAPGSTFNGSTAVTFDYHSFGALPLNNPTPTGALDGSGLTSEKLPVVAGCATTANGMICYDSTNNNWHLRQNGADSLLIPFPSSPTSGYCYEPTLSGGTWSMVSAGGPCGVSGGGAAFSAITSGTNTAATMTVGSGGSLGVSGTGTNAATAIDGVTVTGTPSSGQVITATGGSAATWQTPASSALPQYGFTLNTGAVASPAFPNQVAPVTGTINNCKFITQTSDGSTALTFNIKLAGTSILSGSSATISAGTSSQTVTTLSLTGAISVTLGNIWEFDITSGTTSWTGSLICY